MTGAGTDRTRPLLEGGPAIVLVRPQLAVNIGMCARAMANFGLTDLRLVAPREPWPHTGAVREHGRAAAAGAVHLLESARVFEDLPSAVADLRKLWATTARERGQGKPVLSPREAMRESAEAFQFGEAQGILFGPERTGLDNDEIATADALITFPVNPAYGSLNLAQAVLLTGYEWFLAARGGALPFGPVERSPAAPREMVLSFFDFLESELDKSGFFRPEGKAPVMRRNLRNIFHRIGLTEQDVRTLRGAMTRLAQGPRAQPQTRPRARRSPAVEPD
ncbi:MAG TPA: RNA methyltransferase [Beijerinckiaceae bacterium]|nr:RNA methyltransferase [Beijerinckiaceae bacterium]